MKPFWSSIFGIAVLVTAATDILATLVFLGLGRAGWLLGLWGSAGWFWLNAFLLWRIAASFSAAGPADRARISKWMMIKFPVLYLLGAGFLLIPGVSLYGVLVTFTAFLIGLSGALYTGALNKG